MTTITAIALWAKTVTPTLTVHDVQASIRFFEGLGFGVDQRWEDEGNCSA